MQRRARHQAAAAASQRLSCRRAAPRPRAPRRATTISAAADLLSTQERAGTEKIQQGRQRDRPFREDEHGLDEVLRVIADAAGPVDRLYGTVGKRAMQLAMRDMHELRRVAGKLHRLADRYEAVGQPLGVRAWRALLEYLATPPLPGHFADARARMQRCGVRADGSCWNELLRLRCREGNLSGALGIHKEMQRRGYPLMRHAQNTLLRELSKQGKADVCEGLVTAMHRQGTPPRVVDKLLCVAACTGLEHAAAMATRLGLLEGGMHNMSVVVAEAVLRACVRAGDAESAERVCALIPEGERGDQVHMRVALAHLAAGAEDDPARRQRSLDGVRRAVQRAKEAGKRIPLLTAMELRAISRTGDVAATEEAFERATIVGQIGTAHPWLCLFDVYAEHGKVAETEALRQRMKTHGLLENSHVLSIVRECYRRAGLPHGPEDVKPLPLNTDRGIPRRKNRDMISDPGSPAMQLSI